MKNFTLSISMLTIIFALLFAPALRAQDPCTPTNQAAENITAHTVDLSWENLSGPTWVRFYPSGTQQYHFKFADSNNAFNLTCLQAETDYTWELNTLCDSTWTGYAWPQTFTTLEDTASGCEPTNQITTNISAHGADLSWEGFEGATWVRYYITGTQEYRYKYANENNAVSLTWLTSGAEYTWELNNRCNGQWTNYGWPVNFTTLEDTIVCEPTNQMTDNITAYSADLSWEGLDGPTWVRFYITGTEEYRYRYANTNNAVNLNWLQAETEYTWELRTRCNGQWTNFNWAVTFTTIADTVVCEPTSQLAENVSAHTADLSWEGFSGPTWVRYYITGTEEYRYKFAHEDNVASLTYLASETEYTWELNTFCGGHWTGFDWPVTFTTLADTVVCEPSNQMANNITAHGVDLSWEGLEGETWVRYFETGSTQYRYRYADINNMVSISCLNDNADYTWELNTFCNGMWTGYSWAETFTTPEDTAVGTCEPINLQALNITNNSTDLSWEGIVGATYVRYYVAGTEDYMYKFTTETSTSVNDLLAATDYEWQLNNFCQGAWTGYNASGAFTTLSDSTTSQKANQSQNSFKVSSVEDYSISALSASPNPTNQQTAITFNTGMEGEYTITVVNILGSVVMENHGISSEGLNTLNLDLGNQENGIYFVLLRQMNTLEKVKIIKR